MKGRGHGRRGLGLPVDGLLLLERDLGDTGPDCRGRVAHTLGWPASKTAGIMVRVLRNMLLRLSHAVVATGQYVFDKLPGRLFLWRGTLR
jgi:hypothetical protein